MAVSTGVLLINQFPAERWHRLAQTAEACGYDYFLCADERFFREVYASLTAVALHTRRLRLGPCVTDPYSRHPALTAMAMGTLDEFAGGRGVLCLGAGKSGFSEMGIERRRPAVAIRAAVELIRQLWRRGSADYAGEVIQFHDGRLNFAARPDIPIYVASDSPLIWRVAGEVADGAIIGSCTRAGNLGPAIAQVQRGLAKADRQRGSIRLVARVDLCLHEQSRTALDTLRPIVARKLLRHYPDVSFLEPLGLTVSPELAEKLRTTPYRGFSREPEKVLGVAALVPDEMVYPFCLAGDAATVRRQVQGMLDLGVDELIVCPEPAAGDSIEAMLQRFAGDVLAQFPA